MRWLKWIWAFVFDCIHPRTTWPRRDRAGFAYVCCVDCGRELPYSLRRMSIVSREEQLEDSKQDDGEKLWRVRRKQVAGVPRRLVLQSVVTLQKKEANRQVPASTAVIHLA